MAIINLVVSENNNKPVEFIQKITTMQRFDLGISGFANQKCLIQNCIHVLDVHIINGNVEKNYVFLNEMRIRFE